MLCGLYSNICLKTSVFKVHGLITFVQHRNGQKQRQQNYAGPYCFVEFRNCSNGWIKRLLFDFLTWTWRATHLIVFGNRTHIIQQILRNGAIVAAAMGVKKHHRALLCFGAAVWRQIQHVWDWGPLVHETFFAPIHRYTDTPCAHRCTDTPIAVRASIHDTPIHRVPLR